MIAEKGSVKGALDWAEGFEACWEDSGLVSEVREVEERRSVTAEVADVMVVLEDSIWEDIYILYVNLVGHNLGPGDWLVETFGLQRAVHSYRGRFGLLCSLLPRLMPGEISEHLLQGRQSILYSISHGSGTIVESDFTCLPTRV